MLMFLKMKTNFANDVQLHSMLLQISNFHYIFFKRIRLILHSFAKRFRFILRFFATLKTNSTNNETKLYNL